MSTTTPQHITSPPYVVEQQTHDIVFHPNGTQQGVYTVHIQHRNGVRTRFKVPEAQYNAANVHAMAMHQVEAVQQVEQLPTSAGPTSTQPVVQ